MNIVKKCWISICVDEFPAELWNCFMVGGEKNQINLVKFDRTPAHNLSTTLVKTVFSLCSITFHPFTLFHGEIADQHYHVVTDNVTSVQKTNEHAQDPADLNSAGFPD